MTVEVKRAAHKRHHVYKTLDGKRVPGTTTICGVLDKPALVYWANNLGMEGIKVREYVDTLAGIGTLTHSRVQCYFEKTEPDMSEYSKADIDLSDNAMLSFYAWAKDRKFQDVQCEMPLVSESLRYGGLLDIYCKLDNLWTIIDIKTGKGLYPDHTLQLAGYAHLARENNVPVDQVFLLNIPRRDTEEFQFKALPLEVLADYYQGIFVPARKIYETKKALGWK
tara:strand:- start:2554 stop:3222 length:669 start_codon:yes stop_codon:yes gene_type:complete